MEPLSPFAIKARLIFASIGIVVGVSIFFCFGFAYDNWHCAVWGLTSGVFAALTLGIHLVYVKDEWHRNVHFLGSVMMCGCLGQLAGLCGFVAYMVLAISEHQKLTPNGHGYYLVCVWCAMTWKWAFLLFYFARNYKRLYEAKTGMPSDVPYEKIVEA